MLHRLLELVAPGGVHSHTDLARELGVSEGLLEQMIKELTQRSYLQPVSAHCQGGCTTCTSKGTSAVGSPTRMWALTEKGRLVE